MTATFKGTSLNYSRHGEGPVMVFLHGFLEDLHIWKEVASVFSENYTVILVDLLGHGQSGSIASIHSMDLMADAVNAIVKKENLTRVIIFGHSMGGYVGLAFAERYPELVNGLCLINSTALEDSPSKKIDRDRAVNAVQENYPLFVSIAIPNLFSQKNRLIFKDEISNLIKRALGIPVNNVVAALLGMKNRPNREHVLDKFRDQSLVILGEDDSILEVDAQTNYLEKLKVNFSVICGGHMSFIEEKEEITYKIMQFIEKL